MWLDQIHALKTFILPRYLDLFHTLPVYIPTKILNFWPKSFIDFAWDLKCPKLEVNILFWPANHSGLNLPALKHYYKTANMVNIFKIQQNHFVEFWQDNEATFCKNIVLSDIIWMPLNERSSQIFFFKKHNTYLRPC